MWKSLALAALSMGAFALTTPASADCNNRCDQQHSRRGGSLLDLNANVGGRGGLLDVDANVGGRRGLADIDVNVGGSQRGRGSNNLIDVDANIGGRRGLLDLNADIGSRNRRGGSLLDVDANVGGRSRHNSTVDIDVDVLSSGGVGH